MATPAPLVIWMLGAPNMRLFTLAHAVLLAAFLVTVPAMAPPRGAFDGDLGRGPALDPGRRRLQRSAPPDRSCAAVPGRGVGGRPLLGAVRSAPRGGRGQRRRGGRGRWEGSFEWLAEDERIVYDERSFGLTSLRRPGHERRPPVPRTSPCSSTAGSGHGALGGVLEIVAWAAFAACRFSALLALPRSRARDRRQRRGDRARRLLAHVLGGRGGRGRARVRCIDRGRGHHARSATCPSSGPRCSPWGLIAWPRRAPRCVRCLATADRRFSAASSSPRTATRAGDPRSPQGDEVPGAAPSSSADNGSTMATPATGTRRRSPLSTGFESRTYPVIRCGPSGASPLRVPVHTIEAVVRAAGRGPAPTTSTNDTGLPIADRTAALRAGARPASGSVLDISRSTSTTSTSRACLGPPAPRYPRADSGPEATSPATSSAASANVLSSGISRARS